jgi:amino acid adenylation domain-containing protein
MTEQLGLAVQARTAAIVELDPAADRATSLAADISELSNLTRSQFLIWLGQKLAPNDPLYNMIFSFTIRGEIEPEAFRYAFQALIDRSDALRTVIDEHQGIPSQRVLSKLSYDLEFIDLSADPEPEKSYQTWLEQRKICQFDLSERMFDTVLLKVAAEQFVWYLNVHHLMADVLAFTLIFQRMSEYYQLALKNYLDAASPLPLFQDYVKEESDYLQSPQADKARAYWQPKLAVPFETTDFYGKKLVSKNRPVTRRVVCDLGPERSDKLRTMALQPGIRALTSDMALFHIFAAILFTYLHKTSGQQHLALGAPYHNRPLPLHKETIGLFINVYPLQVEISENETFLTLLKKVMKDSFSSLRYAQYSDLALGKSFDVVLNYLTASFSDFDGLPTENRWIHPGYGDANHSLRLQVQDFGDSGSFKLYFDLNCDVFDEKRQAWAVRHFLTILDSFLADPAQNLGRINLLSAPETQRLLTDFNQTAAAYPSGQTVVQLFEYQVELTPHAVAIECGAQRLTYRELNSRANQVAHYLTAQGVGPDGLVAIHLGRSPNLVIGILGVLKAGGAYVPIDASYPPERTAYILADMARYAQQTSLIMLTEQRLASNLPDNDASIICLDSAWETISGQSRENLPAVATTTDLVYVIYTSGSTGKPKGVMIEHGGLVNYVWWAKNQYLRGEQLNFPLFSSISFDLTVTSIYVPLISGGSVVIYGEEEHVRGMEILRILEDNAVDIIKLTPSHLSLVKKADVTGSGVKKLIVGGEDFKAELAQTISTMFHGNIEIYNEYGPTEAVVGCMIHQFDPDDDIDPSVPIGTPAHNVQIYVLDRYLTPVPTGLIGEIYIAGPGVARGYLNQVELTAAQFVNNPFEPGKKMYRTGDLARWKLNGRLEFLGRADHQVKIRGARIELAEIEKALLAHPDVSECVVDVTRFKPSGEQAELINCARCGLPSNYPGTTFDDEGICNLCRFYDLHEEKIAQYFKTTDDLMEIVDQAKAARVGQYDCLMLLSGGKDSTYALARLVEMGLNPLGFSFDNGYISEEAKANMRRVTDQLNLDLVVEQTPAMPAIFVDSLKRHSNVCNGCFKAIYTLSMNVARKHNIKYIFTGLSRGQLFETRLGFLFQNRVLDIEKMDQAILAARMAYHRVDDAVSRLMDVEIFQDDATFTDIQFVEFYRYVDVGLDEVYDYLGQNLLWTRPADTGRSTNCLINDVGIYVHRQERGYHNYALPYSWDVRLTHKTREAALDELDDDIDVPDVERMLGEIGYDRPASDVNQTEKRLAAYFVAQEQLTTSDLRTYVSETLPDYMIPSYFVQLENVPLTQNGKVDRTALPDPDKYRSELVETKLASIWQQILNVSPIGIHDNFFDLGGASVPAVQVIAQVAQTFHVTLPLNDIFAEPTIAALSQRIESELIAELEDLTDEEAELLLASLQ